MSAWPLNWGASGPLLMGEIASTSEPKEVSDFQQELAARALSQLSASYRPYVQSIPQKKNTRAVHQRVNNYSALAFSNPQMSGENMSQVPATIAQQVMNQGGQQGQGVAQNRSHRKEKGGDYACPVDLCGKSFNSQDKLGRHMVVHSADRPHECTYCHRRFRRVDHLKKHERTHTGEKPFVCDFCGRAFARSDKLYTHKKSHIPESIGNNMSLPPMSNSLVFVQPVSPRDQDYYSV